MKMKILYRLLISTLVISAIFITGCSDDPVGPTEGPVGAPRDVRVSLDAIPGGSSFAVISWSHGANITSNDFIRYRVSTYQVNQNDSIIALLRVDSLGRDISTIQLTLLPDTRYRTYIAAELANDRRTDSVATPVYARIFVTEGEILDEFTLTGISRSGYGWNTSTGAGSRHPFTAGSSQFIDLHMRDSQGLKFFSPNTQQNGTRATLFGIVGEGEEAFRTLNLEEPTLSSVDVQVNQVYLLKTQDNFYIKVWVREIIEQSVTQAFRSVRFDYKFQYISGLRALK
jgi:hypothetical protein